MKLTSLKRDALVNLVSTRLADSIMDDNIDDLREYVMNLETGVTKAVWRWTKLELQYDLVDSGCFNCGAELMIKTAYVEDETGDIQCKSCHGIAPR